MAATTHSSAQSSARPPAQPSYIFRGHSAAIHSVRIIRQNRRLLTGDADGWVISWNLESKRPVAVWKAHEAAILGAEEWSTDKIITHGRDSTLRIWQLGDGDESHLSKVLPADGATVHRPKPWLLHTLPVNTLNFCAFSMCRERAASSHPQTASHAAATDSILVAVPARDDKKIEVYRFPEEKLVYVVPVVQTTDTGMVMAVKLAYHRPSNKLLLIAGYEGGFTAAHVLGPSSQYSPEGTSEPVIQLARTIYLSRPHAQPILSLDALPDANVYFTSSADAVIAAHRIPEVSLNAGDVTASSEEGKDRPQASSTGISGPEHVSADPPAPNEHPQRVSTARGGCSQSASQAKSPSSPQAEKAMNTETSEAEKPNDEATQSPRDTSLNTSTSPSSEPLSFKKIPLPPPSTTSTTSFPKHPLSAPTSPNPSALSSLLSNTPPQPKTTTTPNPPRPTPLTVQRPLKTTQTKHAGQQSLRVRSDGRLFVTGGWDGRVRIYSAKTLREVAVLKWHNAGVYAAAFSEVLHGVGGAAGGGEGSRTGKGEDAEAGESGKEVVIGGTEERLSGLSRLQRLRERRVQAKRWVIAGAKDGKVSLWEVF